MNVIYVGLQSKGEAIIQPLLELGPLNLNISYLPWSDIPDTSYYGLVGHSCALTNITYIPYSLNLYQIDIEGMIDAVRVLTDAITTTPALQASLISFTQYANYGFQLHSSESSVFPYRDVVWNA